MPVKVDVLHPQLEALLDPESGAIEQHDDDPDRAGHLFMTAATSSRLSTTGKRSGTRARGTCPIAPTSISSTCRYRKSNALSA